MRNALTAALFFSLFIFSSAFANGPQVWTVSSRADVLKGDARGVSIDQNGTISLAPQFSEVYKTGQQFVWSSVVDAAGNVYLGTGGDGKIFKVNVAGSGSEFTDLAEMNVSALAIGSGGELFAATSPDGKVYRIDSTGKATVYFEPKEKYIWALAVLADGIAVATGDGGKLYKVKTAGATAEASLMFDSSETHIISLAVDKSGSLYAGTDSNGIVLRFGADGKAFGVLDTPLREIHELAAGPDGSIYVLALAESVAAKPAEAATPAESKPITLEKTAAVETPAKSRYDLKEAKSAVYRIYADGGNDLLWASPSVIGFSIYAHQTGNGVLVGTSDKGRIYNIGNDGRETLALQTDASQISTIRNAGSSLLATSSNQGSVFRIGGNATTGTYESPVLDAKATASWGRIWWRSSGNVSVQTRSGNTEKPDETWSGWSTAVADQKGSQIASPKARFVQWKATFSAAGSSLNELSLAFAARNLAPEVTAVNVLPTNVGLAANPPQQIDPNIELAGMDPIDFGLPNAAVPPRKLYQRGATSLQWTAEDRNGDKLVYDVYYREVSESSWKLLRGDLVDNFVAIDGQSLADGRYVFRVVAKDSPSNPVTLALQGERVTDPIDIDNTAPVVTAAGTPVVAGDKARVSFDAVDAASRITRAEYSVNGGEWRPVYADDGIADGPRERFTVEIAVPNAGEYTVTIKVFDVNANSGNGRQVIRK
ncbi:MAG: hypothetical protein JNL64_12440 [Blastocatellia bacterium]|nr:hypothetical protein [Blastocatellia bacterium]